MPGWTIAPHTALLILGDGTRIEGQGLGAVGHTAGEVCFNTAMTGYQEILTDPSYAGQIITFTFPHIGNVGTNDEDIETVNMAALSGVRASCSRPTSPIHRITAAAKKLDAWLKARNIVGIAGIDTRALTARIRENGMPNGVIAHAPDGAFDEASMQAELSAFPGLEGLDLAGQVTTAQTYSWDETSWEWNKGHATIVRPAIPYRRHRFRRQAQHPQASRRSGRASVTVVLSHNAKCRGHPGTLQPDGVFLVERAWRSGGDRRIRRAGTSRKLIDSADCRFSASAWGISCSVIALGGKTVKMHQGHHGANHPVKDLTTGKVEITSMNHGFAVDRDSLPDSVVETHKSLFDGSNCGLMVTDKPCFRCSTIRKPARSARRPLPVHAFSEHGAQAKGPARSHRGRAESGRRLEQVWFRLNRSTCSMPLFCRVSEASTGSAGKPFPLVLDTL